MEYEYLFIYGVFRDAFNPLLEGSIFCDKVFVYGGIYKVNEFYPGFKRSPYIGRVWGDLVLVDKNILPDLDNFEGEEYKRVKIYTSSGEESWIYEWIGDVDIDSAIRSGDWLLRR